MPPVLIVFSHLRWGFVYQRPQHLLSRLAGRWRVLFVEEPMRCDGEARLDVRNVGPDLQVLVPHTPVDVPGFHDDQLALVQPLLFDHLQEHAIDVDVAWLYTPMALPLVKTVRPACVVYDCMDELSAFRHAPRQLRQRESALLKQAALVFTGGPSLYEARRHRHDNIHCLPSSVDAAHFAPGALVAGSEHDREAQRLQGSLPHPRLGYYGVIDERLDLDLVGRVADSHPEWTLVMVGPVVKIDPATLPQRPNIHWLGMQPYERLPYLLAGWDLCLMPFALNESTRFISPTKTLEYMAGEKPVVSTAVSDVISLYSDAVAVADTPQRFVDACAELLAETGSARCERAIAMLQLVATQSWNRSADTVHRLLMQALQPLRGTAVPADAEAVAEVDALAPVAPLPVLDPAELARVAADEAHALRVARARA